MNIFLIIIVSLFAILSIWSKYKSERIYKITKLIPILILIFYTLISVEFYDVYLILIVIGLFFSLMGDYFLLFPETNFKYGLIFFIFAHLVYSSAFLIDSSEFNLFLLLPVIIYSVIIIKYLEDSISTYKIPIILYIGVISLMLWCSINNYFSSENLRGLLILLGGVLFVISDSLLGINKFKKKFKTAEIFILSSYYTAQLLFTLSIKV